MTNKEYILFALDKCNEAVNNNLETIFVGSEQDDDELIEFYINKNQYLGYMEILLDFAVEVEEFELCEKIIEMKSKLTENFNL